MYLSNCEDVCKKLHYWAIDGQIIGQYMGNLLGNTCIGQHMYRAIQWSNKVSGSVTRGGGKKDGLI